MPTIARALTVALLISRPVLLSATASATPALEPLVPIVVGGEVQEGDDGDAVLTFTISFDQPCDDDSLSILYDVVAGPQLNPG